MVFTAALLDFRHYGLVWRFRHGAVYYRQRWQWLGRPIGHFLHVSWPRWHGEEITETLLLTPFSGKHTFCCSSLFCTIFNLVSSTIFNLVSSTIFELMIKERKYCIFAKRKERFLPTQFHVSFANFLLQKIDFFHAQPGIVLWLAFEFREKVRLVFLQNCCCKKKTTRKWIA